MSEVESEALRGSTFTHNHPPGSLSGFSHGDVTFAAKYGLAEIRMVNEDGRYSYKPHSGNDWGKLSKDMEDVKRARADAERTVTDDWIIYSRVKPPANFPGTDRQWAREEIMRRTANNLNLRFERESWPPATKEQSLTLDPIAIKAIADILVDRDFWVEQEQRFAQGLGNVMVESYEAGQKYAAAAGVGVNFLAPHQEALAATRALQNSWWAKLTETTRSGLRDVLVEWQSIGLGKRGMPDLIAALQGSGLFDRERAKVIAVTETTRVFAEGNRAASDADPAVGGEEWQTAADELVCPICGPRDHHIWPKRQGPAMPAHPRCRCSYQPASWEYIRAHQGMWHGGALPAEEPLPMEQPAALMVPVKPVGEATWSTYGGIAGTPSEGKYVQLGNNRISVLSSQKQANFQYGTLNDMASKIPEADRDIAADHPEGLKIVLGDGPGEGKYTLGNPAGYYNPATDVIYVATWKRSPRAIQETLAHEFGHRAQLATRKMEDDPEWHKVADAYALNPGSTQVTWQMTSSVGIYHSLESGDGIQKGRREIFAEAYGAHITSPKKMKQRAPALESFMVKRVFHG